MKNDTRILGAVSFISVALGRQICSYENDILCWEYENWESNEYFAIQIHCAEREIAIHEDLPCSIANEVIGWALENNFELAQIGEEDISPPKPERKNSLIPEDLYLAMRKEMQRRNERRKALKGNR